MADELMPSRAALLELRDEREVMQAGQAFLDEKRTLIAATLVSMLRRHRALQARFRTMFLEAIEALRTALARHGLEALQAYPKEPLPVAELMLKPSELLGVALLEAELEMQTDQAPDEFGDGIRSVQAERCRQRFAELLPAAVELAALESNLRRLYAEYRKTERRASALEDVLIPELDEQLHGLEELLEAQEIEEAVRVRVKRRSA
ncbi:MAG: V-type ATP synthase subunit D [Acidihalobacter sp.]